ncbi:MAG: DUF58 domain-containing protein [Phycisphaerales bacterium]|nr:DUF58 domain-containing protein [Phycisphaerales bacterium]
MTNTNRWIPAFGLVIGEAGSRGRSRRRGRGASGKAGAAWWRVAEAGFAFVAHVAGRQTVQAEAVVPARARGVGRLTGIEVTSTFPFGIARKALEFDEAGEVLVRPRAPGLRRAVLEALIGAGEHTAGQSPRQGRSDEFYGLRPYVPGDSPRLIAWRPTARTGTLVTKQTTDPAARRMFITLALERPADGEDRALAEAAISLAAALALRALDEGMIVGLAAPAAGIAITPSASPRQRAAVLDALARVDLDGLTPGAMPRVPRGCACVAVLQRSGMEDSAPARSARLTAAELAGLSAPEAG